MLKSITKEQVREFVKREFAESSPHLSGMFGGGTVECIWSFLVEFGLAEISDDRK